MVRIFRIRTEYGDIRSNSPCSVRNLGKIGTKNTPNTNTFHVVIVDDCYLHIFDLLSANFFKEKHQIMNKIS